MIVDKNLVMSLEILISQKKDVNLKIQDTIPMCFLQKFNKL